MARRIVCRCRSRPSSPIHAMSAAYSRSSLRSKQPPPSARHVRPHGPEPSAPHGSGLQERICSSSCLSWLHLLKSWSLRQSRGGSIVPRGDDQNVYLVADGLARTGRIWSEADFERTDLEAVVLDLLVSSEVTASIDGRLIHDHQA